MNNIEVILKDKEDYVSKFNNDRISLDLSNYLINELKTFKLSDKLKIQVSSNFNMSEVEKYGLIKMIKDSYNDDILEIKILSRKLVLVDISIFLAGLICLILYTLSKNVAVMSELILIVGWVLIWEAIYNAIFTKANDKIRIKRRKQLVNSEIIFKE